MNIRSIVLLGTVCLSPLFGQGGGTPSSSGTVPDLVFTHLAAGEPNELTLTGLAPGAPTWLLVSDHAADAPLQSLGLGPAVLGPDLASPVAAAYQVPAADALGVVVMPVLVPAWLAHVPFHLQAVSIDPGAPFGGVAFARHRVSIFGLERDRFAVASPNGDGTFALRERFGYGAPAAPADPRLSDVTFRGPRLANSNEMAFGRGDRATRDDFFDVGPVLRLPTGGFLLLVRSSTYEDGLLHVTPEGAIRVLVWAQGTATTPALQREIAVSCLDPYAAVAASAPLAEYGGSRLVLVRLDGSNVPGSHLDVVGVPAPSGLDVDGGSLCFLEGALFYGDGSDVLRRFDLATGLASPVVFPPSGGQTPVYVDGCCAVSENDQVLVIGAGEDEESHDVYLVDTAGVATNVTDSPFDYSPADPSDPEGIHLAVDPSGTRVAFLRMGATHKEAFVRDVLLQETAHVTNTQQFSTYIDTVVGLRFSDSSFLLFAGGVDEENLDVYGAAITAHSGYATQVSNISVTSGSAVPPFGVGSTLELERMFSSGPATLMALDDAVGDRRLQVASGDGATVSLDLDDTEAFFPVTGGVIVADRAAGEVRIRVVTTGYQPAVIASWASPDAGQVLAKSWDELTGEALFVVSHVAGTSLVRVDAAGALVELPGPPVGAISVALDELGRVLVVETSAAGGYQVLQWEPFTGLWLPFSTALPPSAFGRIIG